MAAKTGGGCYEFSAGGLADDHPRQNALPVGDHPQEPPKPVASSMPPKPMNTIKAQLTHPIRQTRTHATKKQPRQHEVTYKNCQ